MATPPETVLLEALKAHAHDLEVADRQKDNFLSAVAHELRSPLNVLNNAAHILRAAPADGAIRDKTFTSMERQIAFMARLIEDLNDLTRVRRGEVALRLAAVDVSALLADSVEMSRPMILARRHRLEVAQPGEPLSVVGDMTRLVQAVSNLLINAAKFTPVGGNIHLEAGREGGEVLIRVRDNGVGIAADMLAHVFDLFVQEAPGEGGGAGGLGIGLALTSHLVALHGGKVSATSAGRGSGSEFVIRLPLSRSIALDPHHAFDVDQRGPSTGR